jgi:hypothetical protein
MPICFHKQNSCDGPPINELAAFIKEQENLPSSNQGAKRQAITACRCNRFIRRCISCDQAILAARD